MDDLQQRIDAEVTKLYPQARSEAWKAYQRAPHVLELAELESLALFGLAQAARRWVPYCAENGHSPWAFNFFAAFCLRRMRGAMLDAMRSQDWVTRSERTRAKVLRDVSQSAPMSESELASAAGMSLEEVRETMALVSARPVSMDAEPCDFADETDVESSALVSAALHAASCAISALDESQQELLVLKYYYGMSVAQAAETIGMRAADAPDAHAGAVSAVHSALLAAVS